MRAIILGLCAVLAFASCDGDGHRKGNTPRGGASLDFGTTDGVSNYAFTPLSDDPNEAISKLSQVIKNKDNGKFIERWEFTQNYDDKGFLTQQSLEEYVSADPAGVAAVEELTKSSLQNSTITYNARGLQETVTTTIHDYYLATNLIQGTIQSTDTFSYDAKDKLIGITHQSTFTNFDAEDFDGDGDTAEVTDNSSYSSELGFNYGEEVDDQIVRHDFKINDDESATAIGTSTFDHSGVFLKNSTAHNALLIYPSDSETDKICEQTSAHTTDILLYDNSENQTHTKYRRGNQESEEIKTITSPWKRDGSTAQISWSSQRFDNSVINNVQLTFQKLKKPVKGLFIGQIGYLDYMPIKMLRNPVYLYGRFFAVPFSWSAPDPEAQFIPPSCNPADAAARAAAEEAEHPAVPVEGGPPEQPPAEVPPPGAEPPPEVPVRLDCVQGQELVEDACVPTVATCNAQNKIRNAAGECEACPAGKHFSVNRCVANRIFICPVGQELVGGVCMNKCPQGQVRDGKFCVAAPFGLQPLR